MHCVSSRKASSKGGCRVVQCLREGGIHGIGRTAAETFAAGNCAVYLFGRRMSCCACSVCGGRLAAECLHRRVALYVSFEEVWVAAGCSVYGGRIAAEFLHQRSALCIP